jgi:hypothetical protein
MGLVSVEKHGLEKAYILFPTIVVNRIKIE